MFFILFILFGLALFILNIATSVWAYRDSKRKGNSQGFTLVVLLGTLFFPVVGLIVYLIIRND
ncbi:PLDc N-terminal domain-containing protein [Halobacillus andaensis]|nr:PLDc N-terminal domain-containing protein [Halobacillus andaensis]